MHLIFQWPYVFLSQSLQCFFSFAVDDKVEKVVHDEQHTSKVEHGWIRFIFCAQRPKMRHTSQQSNAQVQAVHDTKVDFRASAQYATLHGGKRAKNLVEAKEVEVVGQED